MNFNSILPSQLPVVRPDLLFQKIQDDLQLLFRKFNLFEYFVKMLTNFDEQIL
ncbi:hypothetical protein LPQ35_10020 [Geoglobus acetivorans]|uniref:Mobile element protein n=1 Tax=Geoglobus acetivorans TaxID=565033 RepID=A0ABZ3H1Z9_GEOAI